MTFATFANTTTLALAKSQHYAWRTNPIYFITLFSRCCYFFCCLFEMCISTLWFLLLNRKIYFSSYSLLFPSRFTYFRAYTQQSAFFHTIYDCFFLWMLIQLMIFANDFRRCCQHILCFCSRHENVTKYSIHFHYTQRDNTRRDKAIRNSDSLLNLKHAFSFSFHWTDWILH